MGPIKANSYANSVTEVCHQSYVSYKTSHNLVYIVVLSSLVVVVMMLGVVLLILLYNNICVTTSERFI